MAKKTEAPKDFDINEILGINPTENSDKQEKIDGQQKIVLDNEEIDEQALLESMANRSFNDILAQKREQSQKAEDTKTTESDPIAKDIEQSIHIEDNMVHKPAKKPISGVSSKRRKACLLEYQQAFLSVPKITDRKTVFISNELRERIVSIVRRLGTEKSSVSGFIENLVIFHLEEYKEDIESWKRL